MAYGFAWSTIWEAEKPPPVRGSRVEPLLSDLLHEMGLLIDAPPLPPLDYRPVLSPAGAAAFTDFFDRREDWVSSPPIPTHRTDGYQTLGFALPQVADLAEFHDMWPVGNPARADSFATYRAHLRYAADLALIDTIRAPVRFVPITDLA